jgi:hypothetical protein
VCELPGSAAFCSAADGGSWTQPPSSAEFVECAPDWGERGALWLITLQQRSDEQDSGMTVVVEANGSTMQ